MQIREKLMHFEQQNGQKPHFSPFQTFKIQNVIYSDLDRLDLWIVKKLIFRIFNPVVCDPLSVFPPFQMADLKLDCLTRPSAQLDNKKALRKFKPQNDEDF